MEEDIVVSKEVFDNWLSKIQTIKRLNDEILEHQKRINRLAELKEQKINSLKFSFENPESAESLDDLI